APNPFFSNSLTTPCSPPCFSMTLFTTDTMPAPTMPPSNPSSIPMSVPSWMNHNRAMSTSRHSIFTATLVMVAALLPHTQAQTRQRFLYAALPGVGGGNNLKYGGAGILVFDIVHEHKFVKRVPLQGAMPDDGR